MTLSQPRGEQRGQPRLLQQPAVPSRGLGTCRAPSSSRGGAHRHCSYPKICSKASAALTPIPAHRGPAWGGGSPVPLPGPATGGTVTKICPHVREQQQRECTSPCRQQPAFHAFFRGRGLVGHCSARGFAPAEPLRCQTHRGRRCLRGGEGPGTAVVRGLRGCPRLPGCGSQGCNVPTGPGNSPPEAAAKILAATGSQGAAAGRSRTNPQRAGSMQGGTRAPQMVWVQAWGSPMILGGGPRIAQSRGSPPARCLQGAARGGGRG